MPAPIVLHNFTLRPRLAAECAKTNISQHQTWCVYECLTWKLWQRVPLPGCFINFPCFIFRTTPLPLCCRAPASAVLPAGFSLISQLTHSLIFNSTLKNFHSSACLKHTHTHTFRAADFTPFCVNRKFVLINLVADGDVCWVLDCMASRVVDFLNTTIKQKLMFSNTEQSQAAQRIPYISNEKSQLNLMWFNF